jgi:hypothetical protein
MSMLGTGFNSLCARRSLKLRKHGFSRGLCLKRGPRRSLRGSHSNPRLAG